MARRSRQDLPGSWHHVINRGLARRPLFEDRTDIRFFLSRLAHEVRRGRLEVHAWCILTTHFHLLVRSPRGELSEAMRRSQNEYSRFFNRRHRRDGSLVRGRFLSRPVTSLAYRQVLVRYIDDNPVKARLVLKPWQYPWGSAGQYVHARGPKWLERSWIEGEARPEGAASFRADDYIRVFGSRIGSASTRLVESRIDSSSPERDELDELVGGAPPKVLAWMRSKARLADGGSVGLPICDPASLRKAVGESRAARGAWKVAPNGRGLCAWELLETGLLRDLASLPWERVASTVGSGLSTCQRRFGLHRRLMREDPAYERVSAQVAGAALRVCLPSRGESG